MLMFRCLANVDISHASFQMLDPFCVGFDLINHRLLRLKHLTGFHISIVNGGIQCLRRAFLLPPTEHTLVFRQCRNAQQLIPPELR